MSQVHDLVPVAVAQSPFSYTAFLLLAAVVALYYVTRIREFLLLAIPAAVYAAMPYLH